MKLRTFIFWPHLIAGVSVGAVILVMSVTGALLTYERQLIAWSDRAFRSVTPSAAAIRLPPETLLERLRDQKPEVQPTGMTISSASDAPVAVTIGAQTLYVDAYTGTILGEGAPGVRRFMSAVRAWHRWLAIDGDARPIARAITGWANLLFLFIVASGVYLWFPRGWRWLQVKPVLLFNGKLRGRARDFNWHNVIGGWCALVLFVIVLGAVPISFPWANALVYRIVGEEPPVATRVGAVGPARPVTEGPRGRGTVSRDSEPIRPRERSSSSSITGLNALWVRAERQVPGWKTINVRIPASPDAPVVFGIDRSGGGQPQLRSTLSFDRASGAVSSYESFADQSLGRRLRSVLRFAHTGEVLGVAGQTIAGLASAGGAFLVWTGIALALRRLRAWIKRRVARPARSVPSPMTDSAGLARDLVEGEPS